MENVLKNYKDFMDSLAHQSLIDSLQSNPKFGTVLTGSALIGSHAVKFIDGGHVNPVIIEMFQIGGYCTTMLVGIFTVLGYVKKFRKDKPNNNGQINDQQHS